MDGSLAPWGRADRGRELHVCSKSKERPLEERSKGLGRSGFGEIDEGE